MTVSLTSPGPSPHDVSPALLLEVCAIPLQNVYQALCRLPSTFLGPPCPPALSSPFEKVGYPKLGL